MVERLELSGSTKERLANLPLRDVTEAARLGMEALGPSMRNVVYNYVMFLSWFEAHGVMDPDEQRRMLEEILQ